VKLAILVNTLIEDNQTVQAESKFSSFLQSMGGSVRRLEQVPEDGPDMVFQGEIRGKPITILIECKSQGEPRYIREAAEQLREYSANYPGAYPMVIAPFITESTAELLNSKGLGYFDLAGNALIDSGPIFIRVTGKTRKNPVQRKLKSLFSPRSSRILRVLLSNPKQRWLLRDLAKEAGVSIGLVSKVKEKLIELEFATESRDVNIAKAGELLSEWSKNYSYSDNKIDRYYSPLSTSEFEKRLGVAGQLRGFRYALTMFSGASKVEGFTRYNFVAFYYSGSAEEMVSDLNLKGTQSGANVWVMTPLDEGVYYGVQQVRDLAIASDVQLYLDLADFKGRGEEQAAAIRDQRLKY
jgi:hypothetical protein